MTGAWDNTPDPDPDPVLYVFIYFVVLFVRILAAPFFATAYGGLRLRPGVRLARPRVHRTQRCRKEGLNETLEKIAILLKVRQRF